MCNTLNNGKGTLRRHLELVVSTVEDRATACQDERDTLRVQLSEKEAEIEALQTQADLRVEYERSTLQELRNQVESLHNSNVSLTESLEQFRRNEKRSDEARQGYLEERSSLLSQLNDAQNALEAQETEIQRIQDRRKEELDDAEEIHKTEVNELQHRVAQVEKEKDKAKADAARTEAEKDGLIEGLKKKCEEKFESLVEQEVQKRLEQIEQATVKAGEHSSRLVQQSGPIPGNIPSALSNAQNGKVRKPITRRNASVMGITGVSQELESLEIFPWNISGRQHNEYVEDPDREDLGTGEFHNEVVDPSAEVVPETQLTMTTGQFTARFNQVSGPSRSHSSSSLSDWPGDELLDMDDNTGSGGDGMQGNPSHSPLKDGSSDNGVDMHSRGSSRNSRLNHPKSQANMSVRMMGPPSIPGSSKEYVPGNHRHSSQFANVESGSTSRVDRSTKGGSSSPAFMHATGSSSKTYGQHAGIATGSLGHQRSSTPQAQSYGSSQKRKGSHFHNESGPSKRHQSRSPSLPRSRHEDLPGPATRSTRNRSEAGSRDASQSGYSPRVPSAQGLVTHSSRRSSAGRNPSHRGMNALSYHNTGSAVPMPSHSNFVKGHQTRGALPYVSKANQV
ncbi:hypothetical protein CC80DRAFT_152202 [Byssothecium circinans]|uniref:Uncharacterized protein n=1 Tax=Byssothecium circinans TaxID=147558 RepID=A0A6A5TM04_9PLEO|nr:hypothetical protein CC80DRAFT_152202 [Byssothecium circinans]